MPAPKIYIIAGEASGDLHGSSLVRELKAYGKDIQFRFWGGDLMSKELGKPVKHIKDLAFMGFLDVLKHLKEVLGNITFCKKDILAFQPDALILIDYPGFNLRIAKWAKKHGIKVIYYISPKVWAWRQKRALKIKETVDLMLTIFPFETEFYQKFDYPVEYVGNPLVDAIQAFQKGQKSNFKESHQLSEKPILALLPGSRKQEIAKILPVMLQASNEFSNYQIIVAGAPNMTLEFYHQFVPEGVDIVFGETYLLLHHAELALVTSGTATLEAALFRVPEVVCYIADPISVKIARLVIKVKYISLVNLIMDREVVRELIQEDCSIEHLKKELTRLEKGSSDRQVMLNDFDQLIALLGEGGASRLAAQKIVEYIEKN